MQELVEEFEKNEKSLKYKKKNQKKKLARDVKENKKLKADKKPYELLNMFDRILF